MKIDCPACQGEGGFTHLDQDVFLPLTRRCDNCRGTGKIEVSDQQELSDEEHDRPMTRLEYDVRYGGDCIHP